jgi:hypothetical protein
VENEHEENTDDDDLPEISEYGTEYDRIREHFVVAPSFGNLTSESCLLMDDNLKRSLFLVSRRIDTTLKTMGSDQLTWELLVQTMSQCPFVIKEDSMEVNIHEIKKHSTHTNLHTEHNIDRKVQDETLEWLRAKICNDDYVQIIGEDNLKNISVLYATYGTNVSDFKQFFSDNETRKMRLLDIGIVRYPSVSRPYIELFRIEINSKRKASTTFTIGHVNSEITLDMHSKKYVPNEDVLNRINKDMQAVIDREFMKMMADLGI